MKETKKTENLKLKILLLASWLLLACYLYTKVQGDCGVLLLRVVGRVVQGDCGVLLLRVVGRVVSGESGRRVGKRGFTGMAGKQVTNTSDQDDNQVNDMFKKSKGYHVVPPPYTGNYMPQRADLSFAGLDNYVFKCKVSEIITSVPKIKTNASKTSKNSLEKPKTVRSSAPIIKIGNQIVKMRMCLSLKNKNSLEKPKTVRSSAPIIKDWESDSEDENVFKPKEVKKTVKPSLEKIEFVKARNTTVENENKAKKPRKFSQSPRVNAAKQSSHRASASVSAARRVNTAASRPNMNDALPTTYYYFKAHSPVRRPFNQKSDAKTNDFDEKVNAAKVNNVTTVEPKALVSAVEGNRNNVIKSLACWIWRPKGNLIDHISKDSGSYTLKRFNYELKFNLFSVSQMCDKKNNVLFTDTECVVLSPDFKLLDESQVLLKVPRNNNMYSFDLKNDVPIGGLTCLFVKTTLDESNLWHRRLGHINFKTMNKLMRGNLVRGFPSKVFENDHTCVACQKGNQTNGNADTKANIDAGQTGKKAVPDPGRERAQRNEFESMFGQNKDANGNMMFTHVSAVGSTYVNLGGSIPVNAATLPNADLSTDPLMSDFKDTVDLQDTRIFSSAYDDEVKGAEADFNNLELTTKVWRLVDLPKGKHATGTKWVYRNKKDERGIVVRNKARLVTQGYIQEEGIDYDVVFAPVAMIEAIRLFLAYASFMKFIMYQMDVKSSFLYGTIEDEVYVCQPSGFEDLHFHDKVMQRDDGIFISQDKYVADILKKFNFSSVKTASTPIETNKTSEPIPNVVDEAVYEEWDDRVERAATTASSLDAAQASGNILKTQSTTIPNVPFPQRTGVGGSPRCQEAIGGSIAQTRSERVKELEKTVKTSKARRKAKIVIFDDEEEFEDPFKQGRSMIEEIDQDAKVTLVTPTQVSTQGEVHSQENQPEDQLGVLIAAKVLANTARRNVQTYTRRRAVSTGSGRVSTASRMISTAEE
nr:ribonuclease H-like domain-containing protein [Tanacetum cinerariifolium]